MNERTNGGPNVGLLLLIPAVALVARAAIRHHQLMWDEVGGPEASAPSMRHGRHRFDGPDRGGATRDGLRLPPRIEWMLATWHTRAHQASDVAEPSEQAATPSA